MENVIKMHLRTNDEGNIYTIVFANMLFVVDVFVVISFIIIVVVATVTAAMVLFD